MTILSLIDKQRYKNRDIQLYVAIQRSVKPRPQATPRFILQPWLGVAWGRGYVPYIHVGPKCSPNSTDSQWYTSSGVCPTMSDLFSPDDCLFSKH